MISITSFVVAQFPGAGVGIVIGAFVPAVGRKIKALFVKEAKAVETAVKSGASSVKKDL